MARLRVVALAALSVGSMLAVAQGALAKGATRQAPSVNPVLYATCGGSERACMRSVLGVLNADRAARHVPALHLSNAQSLGMGSCIGSIGHSYAMAKSGTIWHQNGRYPHASFPHNVCRPRGLIGENVGESSSGNVLDDVQSLDRLMMSEPHSAHACATMLTHACNILNSEYKHVGIGIYLDGNGGTWLTEDFTG